MKKHNDWKMQLDKLDKERKQMMKPLKKYIRQGYGPRCKEFAWGCAACSAWLAYDILNT